MREKSSIKGKRRVGTGTFKANPRMYQLLNTILASGQISYGKYAKQYEKRFAELHDSKYCISSNSGTSSLQVALQAIKEINNIPDGYEVIIPATTFVATANIVIHNNLKPVFVDVGPDSYNIDVNLIEDAITDKTVGIIPVHLFGQPADMLDVMSIAHRRGLFVIEDSCECMFVKHHDQVVGSWGDIGCFSTYSAHLLVTGVGGMAVTNNPRYAGRMRSLVNHGLSLDHLNIDDNYASNPVIGRQFLFDSVGHSFRITEMEAAIGLAQIETDEQIKEMLKGRRKNARHLTAGMRAINDIFFEGSPFGIQAPIIKEHNEHAWMMYPIVLLGETKYSLTKYLNDYLIETRDMLPLLPHEPYKEFIGDKRFPVSEHLLDHGFYVGCHQDLGGDDIQYIINVIRQYFDDKKTKGIQTE